MHHKHVLPSSHFIPYRRKIDESCFQLDAALSRCYAKRNAIMKEGADFAQRSAALIHKAEQLLKMTVNILRLLNQQGGDDDTTD